MNTSTSPVNDDSTLQPEAVLIVVVAASRRSAVVAKAGIEILSLDEAQGEFLAHFDLKPSPYCHGESVPGVSVASSGINAIRCAALASERDARPAEVDLEKWFELAAVSIGKPRPEQVGELVSVNRIAEAVRIAEDLATSQISRNADHTTHVVGDRASATSAI
jgi:hypothetical protein